MTKRPLLIAAASFVTVAFFGAAPAVAEHESSGVSPHGCSSGAHTLAPYASHVYPDMGNGGYQSVHTDVHLVYDAASNKFLPGNHVDLTDRAIQCLTDFSVDFERTSIDPVGGPDLTVKSITVNGRPARFTFVQPTYPGDRKGQNDRDPRAHEMSQLNPVGGPKANPLPPACSPELTGSAAANSRNGEQCPANKLVITPSRKITAGQRFTVTVNYVGRPGVHNDGDGSTEGWFRSNDPAGDGGFVTTEPVGTMDWMPLNNHPSAKPTYDFYDTVNKGKTAVANGVLISSTANKPDHNFPAGSTTWRWHSPAPIANYLVESSVGSFNLSERTADNGVRYYEVQGSSIPAAQQQKNLVIMNQQQDITNFQSLFNGTYPFTSAGVLVGVPSASFEEEMQTMITFAGGQVDLDTLNHENMHQWWGDNVSEGQFNLTFFKEGFATLGEYLFAARNAETAAGGPYSAAGQAAFEAALVTQFNKSYANSGSLWKAAPSNPTPYTLFSGSSTYTRPGTAYIALRQILGSSNFTQALQWIQRSYGGRSITERQLESAFGRWLPNRSRACGNKLDQFFTQWFDTAYPSGGVAKPQITGPGLSGPGFYNASGGCS
ncbi:MAG: M1 family aminopeptidase [Jatrophihabitantaceae bacterium]